jgi:hypothetical protein
VATEVKHLAEQAATASKDLGIIRSETSELQRRFTKTDSGAAHRTQFV